MAWVGKDPKDHPVPTTLPWVGTPSATRLFRVPIQPGFQHFCNGASTTSLDKLFLLAYEHPETNTGFYLQQRAQSHLEWQPNFTNWSEFSISKKEMKTPVSFMVSKIYALKNGVSIM